MSQKRLRSGQASQEPHPVFTTKDSLFSILLHIEDPTTLLHASLVCKEWYKIISDPGFLNSCCEKQISQFVGFFAEFDGGDDIEFIPLPLPPEFAYVGKFLLSSFSGGLRNAQDISSGSVLLKLEDSIAIANPFVKSFYTFPLAPSFRNIPGHHCGDFYLFNADSVVRVVVIAAANLLHIQLCVLESDTWIENRNTVDVGISLGEGPFCKTALCVNRFIYMLSIDGFLVKVSMEDCSASLIALPNGSYEWRFQQICRSNYSDFLYVHVDGFDIQIWAYSSDIWTPGFSIHVPSIFACHINVVESLACIEWDKSRSGWGEFLTMYGVSDGADHIIMGIDGVEHVYLLDFINGTVTLVGSNEELIEISPFVTSWLPSFPTFEGKSAEIQYECLDILGDVLDRSGNVITKDHAYMLTAFLTQLSSTEASVRKMSVSCIASLAPCLSDDLLAKATLEVVQLLKNRRQKSEITRTNIQMIGALSCSVGYRFGPHLAEAVPLLISYCTSASENDEELREYSLQALESFMLRCPRDISPYCEDILNLALEYVSYDPNITDSMKEDAHSEVHDEEDDDESAKEYKDDKGASWKVRRASAKCLSAIIVSCPQMLSKIYHEACPMLIDRFKEREENVKMDIFNTFIELLRQTGNVTKGQGDIDESSPRWLLKQEVPKVVKSIDWELYDRSIKTKVGAFSVLKELAVLLPDCLADHFGSLVPWIEMYLNDKSYTSSLKIEAIAFTRILMASHSPSVFHPYIQTLSDAIVSGIGDIYYKVTAEALRACRELVRVLRSYFEARSIDFRPYICPIYEAIWARLANHDQEVNECAISCMSLVIATFGDGLPRELPSCLSVLVDRLGYERTRLTAVKAFAVLANSPLRIDLSCVLDHVVSDLTTFLGKANRALRQATSGTLNSLVVTYGDQIGPSSYETIIAELSIHISDIDLHMSALALELCSTIMVDRSSFQNVGLAVRHNVLPQALILIRSALLQGQTLEALQKFFTALVQSANARFDTLLDSLISTAKPSQSGGLAKQALSSIAQCVAVLCLAAGDQKCASTIEMLKGIINDDSSTNTAKQHIALLCLGEIGRRKDLSNHVQIESTVIESFQSPFEEIKSAASYALGNIAVGNLSKYLPFILDQIDYQQKNPYLLLHSLKEVIAWQSVDHTGQSELQDSNVAKILALLFNHCKSEDEGVQDVVAECLGKIALIEPNKLIPALKECASSPAANTRATVAIAIKYSIVERPGKIDAIMYSEISTFLMLIKDSDMHVRRAAILALSTAAHKKPNLIKGLLPELLPLLYDQTVVKQELVRTVDLGPFKHVVDDGLELRKVAFECVDTLLDSCLDQVNPSPFIVPFLLSGLGDHYDVKMPCHLILAKLADKCPVAVLAVLDSLVEPLEGTIRDKPKGDAVKQEIDRNEDMIHSALRAIAALSRISGSGYSMKLKNLMSKIKATPSLSENESSSSCIC